MNTYLHKDLILFGICPYLLTDPSLQDLLTLMQVDKHATMIQIIKSSLPDHLKEYAPCLLSTSRTTFPSAIQDLMFYSFPEIIVNNNIHAPLLQIIYKRKELFVERYSDEHWWKKERSFRD